MPLRLKKSEHPAGPLVPAWHPNFRNHERLPDTKVVRTQFFVNIVAIVIALVLGLYFLYQEYRIQYLGHQIAEWQSQIDSNQKAAAQAVELSRKFGDEGKKFQELSSFLSQRLVLSEFLVHLGTTLPKTMALDAVDVREIGVELRGTVIGNPDEAAGRTSAYLETLRKDEYFKGIFQNVTLKELTNMQTSGRMSYDVFLHFKQARKK